MKSINFVILEKYLEKKSEQKIVKNLNKRPVIHFSNEAERIFEEGFKFGASLEDIDFTFEDYDTSGNPIRKKEREGIIYGFDTLSYSEENNCYDYEYGIEGGIGMYEESAILLIADVIKTRHPEGFEQCLFYKEDIDLNGIILLRNEGEAYSEGGEQIYDENGNEYDCWSAKLNTGEELICSSDSLDLSDCVSEVIKLMIERGVYQETNIKDYNEVYYNQIELKKPNLNKRANKKFKI